MRKDTLGNHKAEQVLVELFGKCEEHSPRKYSLRLINQLDQHLGNILLKKEDIQTRSTVYKALRDLYFKRVDDSISFDDSIEIHRKIQTYLKNCLNIRLKNFLKNESRTSKIRM